MSLRILFATHGPPDEATAVYRTISLRAESLRRRGDVVDILTPADFRAGRWPRLQPVLLPVALASGDLGRYDVVIFHSYLAWAHALRSRAAASGHRPASVVSFHGLEPLYLRAVAEELRRTDERLSPRFRLLHTVLLPPLLRLACTSADRVICLNERERAFLVDRRWARPERTAVVPNGVSEELLSDDRHHAAVARRLLFTGQWLRAKGIRYLVAAFERLAGEFPDLELTCLGTGAGCDAVLRDFPAPHQRRVRVLPRVDQRQLAAELQRADLFVFPSLSEGFSSALIEAMAAGLPVVATPAGAAPELIASGENGILVPLADADALASAAARLIGDQPRRQSLGAAARETARRHTWHLANQRFAVEIDRAVDVQPR